MVGVIVAGCGGGGSPAPSAAASSGGGGSAVPSAGGEASAGGEPSAAESPGPSSGGGGTAGSVCDLVPDDRLAQILGVPSVTTDVIPGPPDNCDIQSNGAPLAAITWMQQGGGIAFDVYASGSGVTQIPGIGDAAIHDPSSELVIVKKGDQTVSIAVFDDGSKPAEERLEAQKQIAEAAASAF
jgi:hypothetical protein